MAAYERHIFICSNARMEGHPRGSCDPTCEGKLQRLFKKALADHGLNGRVRANKAGCLDRCELGPVFVVYPEGIWYTCSSKEDADEIIESHLKNGKPVERLMLKDEQAELTDTQKAGRA